MLESKQVRHFSQQDLLSLEYFVKTPQNSQTSPMEFYISLFSILNPLDPLSSASN